MSKYFPCIPRKDNFRVILNMSGYLKEDSIDYFKGKGYLQEEGLQEYFLSVIQILQGRK